MDRVLPTSTSLRSTVLPGLTVLLGAGGVLGGLYSFKSPVEMIRQFGIVADASGSGSPFEQRTLIKALGIRNISSGATLLALTAYWQLSPLCRGSPVSAAAVKMSIGLSLFVGSVVAAVDSYILSQLAGSAAVAEEARQVSSDASKGHAITALAILSLALGYVVLS